MKITANNTVRPKLIKLSVRLLQTIAWWAQVTVHPDKSKIRVFKSGISQGLNTWIPLGGHIEPISTVGAKLLWKNAQKNAKKKGLLIQ